MLVERTVRSFDATPIHATSEGCGPTVVLCDGLGCDGFIWRYLRPVLAQSFRVVHWNLRGHGKSGTPNDLDTLGIESARRDLMAVLDEFQVERAVLMGHSMGVQVACELALRHPERVVALVAICGAYGEPLSTFHNASLVGRLWPWVSSATTRFPSAARWFWRRTLASEVLYQYATAFEVSGPLVKRADFQPYFDHLLRMDVEVFVRTLAAAQQHNVEDELERIEIPTLVIGGSNDTFTPAWIARRMASLVPGAELLVVPGGTHVTPIELPEILWLRLEAFLAQHGLAERAPVPVPAPISVDERVASKTTRRKRRKARLGAIEQSE